jgi:4-hydroxy-3-methylbut-2-en-1-yl diphosphate reductase
MKIIVAKPRGFCAGVERAIKCVERALDAFGPPVYVLNHIVHNQHVVKTLRGKGAVFVQDLADVPEGAHLLFSAHGVGPDRWREAQTRRLDVIDATCPLVERVHRQARRFSAEGYSIILIGKAGHDETVGTMGWAGENIQLIQTVAEAETIQVAEPDRAAFITQTTLSVEDCMEIIGVLKRRFPGIQGPPRADICYATTNRQVAVKALAENADLVLVVGDPESANSTRLAEVARTTATPAHLIPDAEAIDMAWLEDAGAVLITSGASVPETLVRGVIAFLEHRAACEVIEETLVEENVHFRLPAAMEEEK